MINEKDKGEEKLNIVSFTHQPVYVNGKNAAEGENNIKYASSYPMN